MATSIDGNLNDRLIAKSLIGGKKIDKMSDSELRAKIDDLCFVANCASIRRSIGIVPIGEAIGMIKAEMEKRGMVDI